jgi:hypothetical protein
MLLSFSKFRLFSALVILSLISCKKEEEFDPVPSITFNSVNTNTIQEFSGPLIFAIGYKDGDGDLGENADGVHNLFVTDLRNGLVYPYRIQSLSPVSGSPVHIQGVLEVNFSPVALTDSVATQAAVFEIYVVDRAGRKSNTVTSTSVTITR